MTRARRLILAGLSALSLLSSVAASFAQVPAPVPALPDSERRTSYTITASTCACTVNMALYGDSTDYQSWVEVWLNGVNVSYNDPAFGWTISSPTGPIATIPRPITDGVLTFNSAQTGTVQIVGARRPRRVSQFSENQGVPARNLNQVLTDIIAMLREAWDKINDVTGRGVFAPPGETLKTLPPAAQRANMGVCFDSSGNLVPCIGSSAGSFNAGSGIAFTGTNPTTISASGATYIPGAGISFTGTNPTVISSALTALCSFAPSVCTAALGYTNIIWYGAVCDGMTDDTAHIQAAMTGTPAGGTLFIPGTTTGCLIKQQGSNLYALLQDHPFSIKGAGHFSNLKTDPSIPSTVDDLLVQVGSFDWANTVWEGFNIGDSPSFLPPTFQAYTRHGKRGLALVDTTFAGFIGITIRNMTIGESGNDYSVYLGNPGQSGSQFNVITLNKIWGGIHLNDVADSHRITYNVLQGTSTFGGLMEFVSGAGKFEFSGNNVTWVGGLKIEGSTKPAVINNYFEELVATSESNNAVVDFNGGLSTIAMPTFTGNIVNATVSTTSTPVRFGNATNSIFGDNWITTSNVRTGVTSNTSLSCIAPNVWNNASPHFSTSLANSYPGC
jgi:hypothetical protein